MTQVRKNEIAAFFAAAENAHAIHLEGEKVGLLKPFNISAAYWEKCTQAEKDYFKVRVGMRTDSIQEVKTKISALRKQVPNVVKIFSKGVTLDKDGNYWIFTGIDTKEWRPAK